MIRKMPGYEELRGANLTGSLPADSMQVFVDQFPNMTILCVFDSSDVSYLGLVHIRQLKRLQTLFLGKLSNATFKMMENMLTAVFDPQKEIQSWQLLEEAHFAGMPISDTALKHLSEMPRLKRLNLSGCTGFTVQGLRYLMKKGEALEVLSIEDCPAIDAFAIKDFRTARPNVQLKANDAVDLSAVRLAVEEADRRIKDLKDRQTVLKDRQTVKGSNIVLPADQITDSAAVQLATQQADSRMSHLSPVKFSPVNYFVFLSKLTKSEHFIVETDKVELDKLDKGKVYQFYTEQLDIIGVDGSLRNEDDPHLHWLRFDLILQEYVTLSRTAWALRKQLFDVGFFIKSKSDDPPPPERVEDIIHLLKFQTPSGENPFVRKIQEFDFTDLELTTHLPYFISDEPKWPQLRLIKVEGTHLIALSDTFTARTRCPKLTKVIYGKDEEDTFEPVLSPRTKDLPLPPEMLLADELPDMDETKTAPEKVKPRSFNFLDLWKKK